ncbi:hypothetical protein AMK59_6574 [Oryctes borbonicus]|uniref:BOD1/SHG1 domain-containing protein n=1 Tax=Oryctes borbonicus TaxID=1629725 RepID=A0A0T6AYE2_9SCAR|nr:hypothetical protein AMK59_6574 [Oryctes borbonicus]
MAVVQNYLPGDPLLIDKIVYELKSQGIFDQFRKECIADVDTKPAYQNLRQRVEGSVNGFLNKQKWSPDMNKNQLREMLKKNIQESGFLETGVERIVDQVVNPKINSIFLPKVTEVVYQFLGIEQKELVDSKPDLKLELDKDNLLPTDLEAVSPESEKKFDVSNDSQNLDDSKIDEDESPPFEPLEEKPVYPIATEENSMDSHLSGFSGLMSHDSNHSQELSKTTQMEASNQDSMLSKQSSEGRLSIVMSDDNDTKMEVSDDSPQQKQLKTNRSELKSFNFQSEITTSNSGKKIDEKSSKSERSSKRDDKHKSRHDSKSERDSKRDEKSKRNDKDRKEHKDKDKHSSRDKTKDKDRRDSKSSKSESSKKEGDKDNKTDKNKSSSRHSSSSKDKDKEKSSSSKKESSKDAKDRGDNKEKDRPKSSSTKDREPKHKDDNSKHSSSKHESRSDKHKKDDKHHKSEKHASSNSKNRDKDKKDPKKDKKENKDDHFSSKKRSDRRSTDRDSNDGHSGLKSSSSSFDSYSSSQTQGKGRESSNSNSNSNNGSGDSNSDALESIITANMNSEEIKKHLNHLGIPPFKLIKPKFASNIHEARRLMKIRKQIALLEKQNLLTAAKAISQKIIENNKQNSAGLEHKNNNKTTNLNAVKQKPFSEPTSPIRKQKEPTPEPLSPPLKSSVVSAATWDALEAKLHESITYTTGYEELDGSEDVVMQEPEIITKNKDDCLYLEADSQNGKVHRFQQFTTKYIVNLENSITPNAPNLKKETSDKELDEKETHNNHVNNVSKSIKRKFSDYNSDIKNNNNSNKKFNTHHIEVHDNFSLPLSPAESDNSIDKKSDMSDSSDKAVKKTETELIVKKSNRASLNNQRYSSEDLYKPRNMFGSSRRRNVRNLTLD